MKSVLISIRPKWCELIASGKKTIEVRKTKPKLETPFKVYIYETQGKLRWCNKCNDDNCCLPYPGAACFEGKGKVIGEFVCDDISINGVGYRLGVEGYWSLKDGTCLSMPELMNYGRWKLLYGWHISDLKIYDKPKELHEFYKCGFSTMEELDEELCGYCSPTNYGEVSSCVTPNGFSSCEGMFCDDAYQKYLDDNFSLARPPQSWCYVESRGENYVP